jgi:8-amino-7-oxononanoate synthase
MNNHFAATQPNSLDQFLAQRLESLQSEGLHRALRRIDSAQGTHIHVQGRSLINFSSNDYLGLANEPSLKEATIEAVRIFGIGSGASRLISGSLAPHARLEEAIAAFKGVEAALAFSTGYAAAIGTICALAGPNDIIILDKLSHACLVDAARLARAKLRVFAHNNLNHLERLLKWAASQPRQPGFQPSILLVTESLFSMDGDAAPLREIVELKERYGAWLMVDEAHATGLYGTHRRGLAEEMGVANRIEIQMGTMGKALGASGGYICGSRKLIDYLVNRARSFIFSTAPVPAASAAATEAIKFVQSKEGEERCASLWQRVGELPTEYRSQVPGRVNNIRSAIIPIHIGEETNATNMAGTLLTAGLFVPAIRFPTVSRGKARLRVSISATHTAEDITILSRTLRKVHPIQSHQQTTADHSLPINA